MSEDDYGDGDDDNKDDSDDDNDDNNNNNYNENSDDDNDIESKQHLFDVDDSLIDRKGQKPLNHTVWLFYMCRNPTSIIPKLLLSLKELIIFRISA